MVHRTMVSMRIIRRLLPHRPLCVSGPDVRAALAAAAAAPAPKPDPFETSLAVLEDHRATSALAWRHVTVQCAIGGLSYCDEGGFDLTPDELDELAAAVGSLTGPGLTLQEVRDEIARATRGKVRHERRCAAEAGLPSHWCEGAFAGFGFNLEGGRFADTNIVRRGGGSLVYLDGRGADSSFFGHPHPTELHGCGLTRGPWVWRGDGRRWADPSRSVEAVAMRAVARRGGADLVEEIFGDRDGTGIERTVWHHLLRPATPRTLLARLPPIGPRHPSRREGSSWGPLPGRTGRSGRG